MRRLPHSGPYPVRADIVVHDCRTLDALLQACLIFADRLEPFLPGPRRVSGNIARLLAEFFPLPLRCSPDRGVTRSFCDQPSHGR